MPLDLSKSRHFSKSCYNPFIKILLEGEVILNLKALLRFWLKGISKLLPNSINVMNDWEQSESGKTFHGRYGHEMVTTVNEYFKGLWKTHANVCEW